MVSAESLEQVARGRSVAALALSALVGALLVLVLWPASAAHAGAASVRFGVHIDASNAFELQRLGQGRAGIVRTPFLWKVVQPTRDARYRWDRYDALVRKATLNGLPILPVIIGSPKFAARQGSYPPNAKALSAYKRFVVALVNRYGRGGQFWKQPANLALPYRPIRAWQVWNEPNLPQYWNEDPDGREYGEFLKLTGDAIHGADERAEVVIAGMPKSLSSLPGYLDRLYRVRRVKRSFDIGAGHPYGNTVSDVTAGIKAMRRIMNDHGDQKTPLWLTEMGWAGGGPRTRLTTTPQGQAERLQKAFRFVRRNASELRLGTAVWYNSRDLKPRRDTAGGWWQHAGLFWSDGYPKPAWNEFVRFTGGNPGVGRILDEP